MCLLSPCVCVYARCVLCVCGMCFVCVCVCDVCFVCMLRVRAVCLFVRCSSVWGVRLCVYVCVCRRCAPVCEMCLCVCEMCVRVWDVRLCVRCVASCMCAPVRVSVWVRVRYLHDLRQAGILLGGEQAGVQVAAVAVCVRVIRRVCREEAHVQPSTPTLWIKHICVSWMQWWQAKISICKIKLVFLHVPLDRWFFMPLINQTEPP